MQKMAEEHTALIDGLRVRMTKYAERQRRIETIDYDSAAQYFAALGAIPVATWPIDLKFFKQLVWFQFQNAGFDLVEDNKKTLHDLCTYFCGLEGEIRLDRGVFLSGPVGCGKSTLMVMIRNAMAVCYPKYCFEITGLKWLHQRIRENKDFKVSPFAVGHRLLDELGGEGGRILDYGNETQLSPLLLSLRYPHFQEGRYITHATSNLLLEELKQVEGVDARLADRIEEMFTQVIWVGESYRGRPKAPFFKTN